MLSVFISYRRDDSAANAGRIQDRLCDHFGPERVFFDRNTIGPGTDFTQVIEGSVGTASAIVVVIGQKWLRCATADGRRRLDDPEDLVRREISLALNHGLHVYPVLVSGAHPPKPEDLPEEIRGICRLNALELTEKSFQRDLETLIEALDEIRFSADKLVPSHEKTGPTASERVLRKKICMVGSFGVGKTSLVSRFVHSIFSERYLTTVGVKIDKKEVTVGPIRLVLMLWDLAGEDEVTRLRPAHLKGSSAYILVADGLRPETLQRACEMREWVEDALGPVPFVLAVNKADLVDEWPTKYEDIVVHLNQWPVFRTSAKDGQGVNEMFRALAEKLAANG